MPINTTLNTGQMMTNTFENSQIFIWNNRFQDESYTNSTGAAVTILEGTLMGRISATDKVIPLASAASDGSQEPKGILTKTYVVAAGATQTVSMCVMGDVAKEKVILSGADTLETIVSGRRIKDGLQVNTAIKIVAATELTDY